MFSENAINRLNNIKWDCVGENRDEKISDLISEFLRRLAVFSVSRSLHPRPPFFVNVAEELGDKNYEENLSLYSEETLKYLDKNAFMGYIMKYYIQLAFMADKNEGVSKYLEIYEPFIRFFEKGGRVIYRAGFFDIGNISSISVRDWLERADAKPINIDDL